MQEAPLYAVDLSDNNVVDCLAKLGQNVGDQFDILDDPPPEITILF